MTTHPMIAELLPCPFCGAGAIKYRATNVKKPYMAACCSSEACAASSWKLPIQTWNKRKHTDAMGWRPIESAPRELPPFERIVVARFWLDDEGQWNKAWQQVAHWFSPLKSWVIDSIGLAGVSGGQVVIALRDDATHWMPLPQPPTSGE